MPRDSASPIRTWKTGTWQTCQWFQEAHWHVQGLFQLLMGMPDVSPCGTLEATPRILCQRLNDMTREELVRLLKVLEPHVLWFEEHNTLWIRGFYDHQNLGKENNFRTGAHRAAMRQPETIRTAILEEYPQLTTPYQKASKVEDQGVDVALEGASKGVESPLEGSLRKGAGAVPGSASGEFKPNAAGAAQAGVNGERDQGGGSVYDPDCLAAADELVSLGLSAGQASVLASKYGSERVRRQIWLLPFREAKSPVAMLTSAIEHDYAAPAEAVAEIAAAQKRDRELRRRQKSAEGVAARQRQKRVDDQLISSLPEHERVEIERRVREEFRRSEAGRMTLAKHPNGPAIAAEVRARALEYVRDRSP